MRRSGLCSRELEHKFVDVPPVPILTGFVGPGDGMGGSDKGHGCLPSWPLITASDVTALLAHTQMDPVQVA